MPCRCCGSEHQKEVPSEVNIHPPHDRKYVDVPSVLAFPIVKICSECGFTEFLLEDAGLRRLKEVWHAPVIGFSA